MKKMGVLLLVAAAFVGCGGSGSDGSAPASDVDYTWEQGPAPKTDDDLWVLADGATDQEVTDICTGFQYEWPEEAKGLNQVTVANGTEESDKSVICPHVTIE